MELTKETPVVVVTGSSGLIGSAVARRLDRAYRIVGFDTKPPPRGAPVEHHDVDLTQDDSIADALADVRRRHGSRIASVIHLAAYYDFAGEPSPLYEQVTVRGTGRLLRALWAFEVEQFFFSSSILVHAPTEPGRPIDETAPLEPKWDYPASKVQTEELLEQEHGRMPLVIARIAGVYDDMCHSIPIAHQIQRIFEKKLIAQVFPGDSTHGQSFLHLDDLARAVEAIVERRGVLGLRNTFLLGEPTTLSYDEIQRTVSRLIHGEEWETQSIPKAVAKAGAWLQDQLPGEEPFIKPWMIDLADDHYELDITHARLALDWKPKRSLRDVLPRIVSRLVSDPEGFYHTNKLEPPKKLDERADEAHAARVRPAT
jgi:nucleoside-diphosphate-sugar epimerase